MITSLEEKGGGTQCNEVEIKDFWEIISYLHLVDLHRNNGVYTLNNHQGGTHQIAS